MVRADNHTETITAQATPPGRGGITVVRVSGPAVKKIMNNVLGCELAPRQATYLSFRDETGNSIDAGIALFFPNPHSFTGEDVLELHGHGGPVVVDLLLQRIISLGARLARPGEFSERAFLNGKMDLAQAEAIADLIDASSVQAARLALRSLQGDFSKAIHALNEKIIRLRVYIEAAIDFIEEEIDFLSDDNIKNLLHDVIATLAHIQTNAIQGSFLREGITVVIAGEPNVGKSSLLNCLSGKEVAIVTDIPGTTRDVLRDYILMDDMPMHIVDTAGLRESEDVVEREGIKRAHQEIEKADIVLYMQDSSKHSESQHNFLWQTVKNRDVFLDRMDAVPSATKNYVGFQNAVIIRNKIDLVNESPSLLEENGHVVISISAKTGTGIELLKNHIKNRIGFKHQEEGIFLARRRHLEALARAQVHVQAALSQLSETRSGELAAEDLRLAQRALNEITGEFTADDLLGRIFSSFCIGK